MLQLPLITIPPCFHTKAREFPYCVIKTGLETKARNVFSALNQPLEFICSTHFFFG
jgi:hypothetical protein